MRESRTGVLAGVVGLGVVAALASTPPPPDPDAVPGLVAAWHLDGDARCERNYHGTISGDVTKTDSRFA